jgi:hypothetical protein
VPKTGAVISNGASRKLKSANGGMSDTSVMDPDPGVVGFLYEHR